MLHVRYFFGFVASDLLKRLHELTYFGRRIQRPEPPSIDCGAIIEGKISTKRVQNYFLKEVFMKWFVVNFLLLIMVRSVFADNECKPNNENTIYCQSEKVLGTGGPVRQRFHAALYYPRELAIKYDAYLVGIEKSEKDKIDKSDELSLSVPFGNAHDLSNRVAGKDEDDNKTIHFISHVLTNLDANYTKSDKFCYLYSAYTPDHDGSGVEICNGQYATPSVKHSEYSYGWKQSFDALHNLSGHLSESINKNKYTHVILITMGWNTDQEEAIRNINSLAGNIIEASGGGNNKGFKPLFIGATWASLWDDAWLPPQVVTGASFPYKAFDADEVGVTWLSTLVHDVLGEINVPTIVIGHSFGARATSLATCKTPFINGAAYKQIPSRNSKPISLLVSLQGAYPISRLLDEDPSAVASTQNDDIYKKELKDEIASRFKESFPDKVVTSIKGYDFSIYDELPSAARKFVRKDKIPTIKPYDSLVEYGVDIYANIQKQKHFDPISLLMMDRLTKFDSSCTSAKTIALTASDHDQAVKKVEPLGVVYVGSQQAFNEVRDKLNVDLEKKYSFHMSQVDEQGKIEWGTNKLDDHNKTNLIYLDANKLISYNTYRSGGGAHSDIYRKEMGRMICELIDLTESRCSSDKKEDSVGL